MTKKRNKFLTFVFSLLPGAGHMFMGFMRLGVSLMALFFFVIFLSTWLDIGPLMYILPILWFYAFFDCLNKAYASDEDFARFKDHYLFSAERWIHPAGRLPAKSRPIVGAALIFFGAYILWDKLALSLLGRLAPRFHYVLLAITRQIPPFIIGAAIIVVGVRLIAGKKKETENDA